MNCELPDIKLDLEKEQKLLVPLFLRRTRDHIANICWIIKKRKRIPEKKISFCFFDYTKAFVCEDHNKLWKILKEMGIPDHLICRLRNPNAGQEVTVRTGHETTD